LAAPSARRLAWTAWVFWARPLPLGCGAGTALLALVVRRRYPDFRSRARRKVWSMTRYQKRVSGPLLDPLRVDALRDIKGPRVDYNKLTDGRLGEPPKVGGRVWLNAARTSLRTPTCARRP
jgi:hypothetical protein